MPILAEIPDWLPVFSMLAIGLALVALFGLILLLRGLRELRTGLTDEVRRELKSGDQPTRMDVQSPLEIKAHAGVATREELKQVHGRIERERRELDAAIIAVAHTAEKRADKTDAKLDENTAMTQRMSGEVSQINQSVQTLTSSLTNFLQHQARK